MQTGKPARHLVFRQVNALFKFIFIFFLALLSNTIGNAQANQARSEIKGKVIDAKTGLPVIGSSIVIKGNNSGSMSDKEGNFKIQASPGEVLVVSYVGYVPQEVTVTKLNESLVVKLEITSASMQDIVITGLFTRKAATSTGSVSTFSQQELLKAGNTNVIQSLKNLEPSFFVPENNLVGSNPNALPDIQLRGQTGLPDIEGQYATNPNNPLFILDGVPVTLETIMDLDMNRIKSATLLLDASSKAIYGSRAANGVMVIETTVPKSGKLLVSYNSNITIAAPDLNSYNLTNAAEKLDVEKAAGLYNGVSGSQDYSLKQKYNEFLQNVIAGVNTDWLSKPLRNGVGQQHSLSFEGGEAAGMRYQATVRYYNQVGVMKGSDRNTLTGALKLAYRVRSFNFTNTFTINDNKSNNSPWGSFSQYALMNPYLPYEDENGNILKIITNYSRQNGVAGLSIGAPPGYFINDVLYNPAYNSTLNIIDSRKYTQYLNNFNFDWAIQPEFRLNGTFGLSKQIDQSDVFLPAEHLLFTTSEFNGDNAFRKGRYTKSNGNYFNYSANLVATYAKAFGRHVITANLPIGISEMKSNNLTYAVEGFPNDRLSDPALALQYFTGANTRPTGFESQIRRAEGAFTANYAYDDRYFFDVTYGKSKGTDAGESAPWSENWSVGVGMNLHRQAFFQNNLKFINLFKISANTGYVGADGFNAYSSLATYNYYLNNAYTSFGNGAFLTGLANPDLQPQRTQEHGMEARLGLLKKFNLIFRYYIRNTEGLVSNITTPPSTGFTTYIANLGRSQNKGYYANLNYQVFANHNSGNSLNLFFAVAHNTNKLIEVANAFKEFNKSQDGTTSKSPRTRFIEGQSLSTIWAVKSLGIDPATGREVYQKLDGTQTYVWDPADQIAAGDALPKFNGNFGFRLDIKGFDINTIFTYLYGGQQYNQTLVDRVENADLYRNVDRRVYSDRWRKPGDNSFFKNIADFGITQASTRFVEDRNSLTLGALDIGYDLAGAFPGIRNMGFSRLRAGFNTSEVFILSTIQTERGIDYPFARNFTFTLNASF
jgi:TonB-linked SusC/RagA family outer membrane protein